MDAGMFMRSLEFFYHRLFKMWASVNMVLIPFVSPADGSGRVDQGVCSLGPINVAIAGSDPARGMDVRTRFLMLFGVSSLPVSDRNFVYISHLSCAYVITCPALISSL
jgi:hypothetical protein